MTQPTENNSKGENRTVVRIGKTALEALFATHGEEMEIAVTNAAIQSILKTKITRVRTDLLDKAEKSLRATCQSEVESLLKQAGTFNTVSSGWNGKRHLVFRLTDGQKQAIRESMRKQMKVEMASQMREAMDAARDEFRDKLDSYVEMLNESGEAVERSMQGELRSTIRSIVRDEVKTAIVSLASTLSAMSEATCQEGQKK